MSDSKALSVVAPQGAAVTEWNAEEKKLLKDLVAKGATDTELAYFGQQCSRSGLDPFQKQIYCIVRGNDKSRSVTFQTGIDGYRLIAARTGDYDGQDGPFWCGEDGVWKDAWLSKEPPVAARVGVFRKGRNRATYAIALYDEYVQMTAEWQNGQRTGRTMPNSMWLKMPAGQLAKCAEALALRKEFPNDLSGLYTREEMGQAENAYIDVTRSVAQTPGGDTVDAATGEYVDAQPPAPQGQRGNSGGTRAAARAAAQQKAGEMDKPVIHQDAPAPASPTNLRDRMGIPPASSPEPWMVQLREQLEAWDGDGVLAPIKEEGAKSTSVLGEWVGMPVTVNGMRQWAAALGDGQDPFRVIMDLLREKLRAAEAATSQVVGPEEGVSAVPVEDDLPFE